MKVQGNRYINNPEVMEINLLLSYSSIHKKSIRALFW